MSVNSSSCNCHTLVTVVIPAYNAEKTIEATLVSVRSQSHRDLEILVVDDGSTDRTTAIVARHAALDARIRLIRQANGGVARARNEGIAQARGAFVAPVDADDLCSPDRIAKQLVAIEAAGADAALAYTWSAQIDERGIIIVADWKPAHEGRAYEALCTMNFIGNGSATLMRTAAVREVGGYDASLRDRGAQGCEDWALYLAISRKYNFALVPEFLTGYRQASDNMSSNHRRMYKSFLLVARDHLRRDAGSAALLREANVNVLSWLLSLALRDRKFLTAAEFAFSLLMRSPIAVVRSFRHYRVVYGGFKGHGRNKDRKLPTSPLIGQFFKVGAADTCSIEPGS
ncbi:glycosyltransferase family 2 protein [Methylobacterium sp. WSM2598]|uniref:glycosyltransferase family 2 protein n=1 Tax=Methylobacterium sp. WSM2598 TaxID=398261 RepID=UPI0004771F7A|nr:glycosyltransferase family A protein [Methylobacterium sp. WSM2598]